MGWKRVLNHAAEHFFHTSEILIAVFFHALLFVLWIVVDFGAGYLVHSLGEQGIHEWIAHGFRLIASFGIFSIAALPALSDIFEFIGVIRKKFMNSFNLVCKTCPAKQIVQGTAK
ncbi:MAG: hypothetical protein WEB58_07150 [Planctomycetaceae bacterium]